MSGWRRAQRRLHWWGAGLVVLTLGLGFLMVALPWQPLAPKFLAYQLHKSLGLLALLLAAWRLALRLRHGRPEAEPGLPAWHYPAARAVQALLYGLLLAVPVLGYLTAASAPGGVPTTLFLLVPVPHLLGPDPARFSVLAWLHWGLALLLAALAAGHALLALRHHAAGRGELRAMWRGNL